MSTLIIANESRLETLKVQGWLHSAVVKLWNEDIAEFLEFSGHSNIDRWHHQSLMYQDIPQHEDGQDVATFTVHISDESFRALIQPSDAALGTINQYVNNTEIRRTIGKLRESPIKLLCRVPDPSVRNPRYMCCVELSLYAASPELPAVLFAQTKWLAEAITGLTSFAYEQLTKNNRIDMSHFQVTFEGRFLDSQRTHGSGGIETWIVSYHIEVPASTCSQLASLAHRPSTFSVSGNDFGMLIRRSMSGGLRQALASISALYRASAPAARRRASVSHHIASVTFEAGSSAFHVSHGTEQYLKLKIGPFQALDRPSPARIPALSYVVEATFLPQREREPNEYFVPTRAPKKFVDPRINPHDVFMLRQQGYY